MVRIGFMIGLFSISAGMCLAAEPGYRCADLPPLLRFLDGAKVRTREDWSRRAAEIRDLMCTYFIGTFPQIVPAIEHAGVVNEKVTDGITRRRVELTFATPHKLTCELELWIPRGDGPFPALLLQPNVDQLAWARMACARGYLVCLYPGLDGHNKEPDYPGFETVSAKFRAEYPSSTWTEISSKAWLASRAIDYLLDPANGCHVARREIAIIGHSRYGKQALIAAAFDQRITAVVAVSAGSPGSCAYRFTSRDTFMESPADFEKGWFLESLKSYAGRENDLPIDAHAWLALIAPRRCMLDTAYNDQCEPTFAVERSYLAAKEVYNLLGHSDNVRLDYRPGGHYPLTDARRAEDLDYLDASFGRAPSVTIKEVLLHHFDWDKWKSMQPLSELTPPDTSDKRARVLWSLGEPPVDMPKWNGKPRYETDSEAKLLLRDRKAAHNTVRVPVCFGDGVRGSVYFDPSLKGPLPVVIWLHPYSYSMGYSEVYGAPSTAIYSHLASEGFLVLAYDQLGFGLRLLEGPAFYDKHPKWSRLGRMVSDVSAAADFLIDGKGASKTPIPQAKKDAIYVLGYSLGGMVGLYATALDDRIAGVASFCGFTPLRTDDDTKPTGGIRRLWEWHALQPRLGLFNGREADIPFDYDDILSLVAPRPCLIESPTKDRYANPDVTACVDAARTAWKTQGTEANLTFLTPEDYNRFQAKQQATFVEWVKKLAQRLRAL
jgi:pimeloyl-ACP methyl ester carboxylesterase